jgi:hypothetical protein
MAVVLLGPWAFSILFIVSGATFERAPNSRCVNSASSRSSRSFLPSTSSATVSVLFSFFLSAANFLLILLDEA